MEDKMKSKILNPNSKILKILLIEDNPGDARLIEEMLKEAGLQFEMECVDRLSSGIGQIKLDGFDVILLDLGLPDSEGLGTLMKLNETRPEAPVIVLTGLADEAVGTQAVKEGAQDYLIKGQTDHNLLSRSIRYAIERKKADDQIVASEQKYRILVETMNEGLGIQDKNGIITYMNRYACEMFGYKLEELIGKSVDVLFDEEGLEIFKAQMAQRRRGKEESYEVVWRRKDGVSVHSIVSPHVIFDSEGNFDGSFGVFVDITERKKTEEALRESEARLRTLSDNLTGGLVYQIDSGEDGQQRRFTYISASVEQMHGITAAEVLNDALAFYGQVVEEDRHLVVERETLALANMSPFSVEVRLRLPSGEIRWGFFASTPRRLPNNHLVWDGVEIDVTERKRTEEAFHALFLRQEAILATVPDIIMEVDKNKVYTWVNQAGLDFFGNDVIGKEAAFYFEGEQDTYQTVQPLFNGQPDIFYVESWQRRKDGQKRLLAWWCRGLKDEHGNLIGALSSAQDITEHRKSQEALQKSETFVKNILESVGEGFIVIDPEYRIISANKAYCEMQKTRLEDIIGKHCHEVSHHRKTPCFLEEEECAPKLTFKTGEPQFTIHTHYDKEENPIYIETRSYPMKDAEGKIFAVIEILNDITEKRLLESQLRHAQKMEAIGTLAGGIAHDFNNMLNVIIGYASLMQMNMSHDDPKLEQVKEILGAGDRAAHLTRGLLTFSRKQVMEVRKINLNEIIEGFKKMLARIIGEDIELRINLTPPASVTPLSSPLKLRRDRGGEGELIINADIVQIEQVLMNLASNAKDAMPKGGVLTIETTPIHIDSAFIRMHGYGEPGVHALITVSDTGAGMDDKTRERIFEPFFTTKEFGRGTGLGLSIAYGIVKQHSGYINCYSEPGKGTTFKIYLPLIKEEAERIDMAEAELSKGGTETILIAEDDASVRGLIKEILGGVGYKVIEAIDGEDAVMKFKENRDNIHLLLFDLIMPRKNGKDAYEDIKGIRHDIKVIFTSGYAADIMQKFGIEEGIEFISKPVFPNELLRKVRDMLG